METPPSSFSSSVFECAAVTSPESASSDYQLDLQCHHLLLQIQRLVDRYDDCFLNLQQSLADVDLLSLDNRQLAAENLDLAFLVNEKEAEDAAAATLASSSKKSLATPESGKQQPKSISIRSPGFLTVKHPPPGSSGDGSSTYRLRTGGEEVEVYEQGTTKTELCNKWGENGRCSYGEGCRFAHGMQELRPVIRHPRFKTQLCRIVGAGGNCPYGHRCHFRHASLPDPRAG